MNNSIGFPHCKNDCGLIEVADTGTFHIYNLVLQGSFLPTLAIFGFSGNLCALWVFTRPEMRIVQLNRYFAALATSDAIVVVSSTFIFSIDAFQHAKLAQRLYVMFTPTLYPLAGIAHTASIYFTIAAGFHCFLEQCQYKVKCIRMIPFESLTFFCCTIFGVLSGAVAFNTTKMLEIEAVFCWGESHPEPKRVICVTALGKDVQYFTVYYLYMYPAFMVIGPLVILGILTSFIIWFLVTKRRRRSGSTDDAAEPTAFVMVVMLFISCNSLSLIQNFLEQMEDSKIQNAMPYIIDISNTLVVLNSSLNFVIYLVFDAKFRHVFKREFCCCAPKHRSRPLKTASSRSDYAGLPICPNSENSLLEESSETKTHVDSNHQHIVENSTVNHAVTILSTEV